MVLCRGVYPQRLPRSHVGRSHSLSPRVHPPLPVLTSTGHAAAPRQTPALRGDASGRPWAGEWCAHNSAREWCSAWHSASRATCLVSGLRSHRQPHKRACAAPSAAATIHFFCFILFFFVLCFSCTSYVLYIVHIVSRTPYFIVSSLRLVSQATSLGLREPN